MAIEARLRDALKVTPNTDIRDTLDALEDFDDFEALFVSLYKMYENVLVEEYHYEHSGSSKYEKMKEEFFRAFNKLGDLFSNHPEVQRARRASDDEVRKASSGQAAIVRGKGVVFTTKQSQSASTQSWCSSQQKYAQQLSPGASQAMQASQAQVAKLMQLVPPTLSSCKVCQNALTVKDTEPDTCNACHAFSKKHPVSQRCTGCSMTYTVGLNGGNSLCDTCIAVAASRACVTCGRQYDMKNGGDKDYCANCFAKNQLVNQALQLQQALQKQSANSLNVASKKKKNLWQKIGDSLLDVFYGG